MARVQTKKIHKKRRLKKKNPHRTESFIIPKKPFYRTIINNIPFTIDNRSGNVYVGNYLEARINILDPDLSWEFFDTDERKIPYIKRAIQKWNIDRSDKKMTPPNLE